MIIIINEINNSMFAGSNLQLIQLSEKGIGGQDTTQSTRRPGSQTVTKYVLWRHSGGIWYQTLFTSS